jgi:hypothetical protein
MEPRAEKRGMKCVHGAARAMETMEIIKLAGGDRANFGARSWLPFSRVRMRGAYS